MNATSNSDYETITQFEIDDFSDEDTFDSDELKLFLLKDTLYEKYNSQRLNILHSPDKTEHIESLGLGTKIHNMIEKNIFFHATSYSNYIPILTHGLIPFPGGVSTGLTQFINGNLEDPEVKEHVYLTSTISLSQFYGFLLSERKQVKHIIFGIFIPNNILSRLLPDDQTTIFKGEKISAFKYKGNIPSDYIFNPLIHPFEIENIIIKNIIKELEITPEKELYKDISYYIMNKFYKFYLGNDKFKINLPKNKFDDPLNQIKCL